MDDDVATEVKTSLLRHLWYLTQPVVVLGLFDPEVGLQERGNIAQILLQQQQPAQFVVRKTAFPTHIIQAGQSTLSSFVGPDSWLLFSLLGTDHAWLTLPPAQWSDNVHYAEMSTVIRDLAVVNDTAERCIKDIQDYANAANDGDHRGNIILVSASHRIKIPSFLKNEMEENLWSLYFSAENRYFCWTNNLLRYLMYGSVISSASEKHARQYNFHILSYFWV